MPRKRHVSRNDIDEYDKKISIVMPRKRHVSRNFNVMEQVKEFAVMPRKRHVSRNITGESVKDICITSCLARGM